MTAEHQELIDEIMDNFDFDKVHKAMEALDWEWVKDGYDKDKPMLEQMSVPDVSTIRRQARRHLKEVIEGNLYAVGTGGLKATWHEGVLSLEFILAEWEASHDSD